MNAQLDRILPRHASFTYRGKNKLTLIIYDLRIFHKITTRLWRRYFIKKLEQFNLTQQSLPLHLHSHVKCIKECLRNISRGWLENSFKKCLYRKLYLIQRIIIFAVSFHEADHIERDTALTFLNFQFITNPNFFYSLTLIEWNKLDARICNSETLLLLQQ